MVVYFICDSEYARHYLLKQEVAAQTYSVKKTFLEISENSQENACASVSFLIKLQALFLQNTSGGCFWSTEIQ